MFANNFFLIVILTLILLSGCTSALLWQSIPDSIENEKNVYAYSITTTVPKGYSVMIQKHPDLEVLLNKIIRPTCNALHIVSLRMRETGVIPLHQDDSINEHIESQLYILPDLVSVYYINVPHDIEGGVLRLVGGEDVQSVKPKTNMLVQFAGDTWHECTKIVKSSTVRRMFVVEQYALSRRNLRKMSGYDTPKLLKG